MSITTHNDPKMPAVERINPLLDPGLQAQVHASVATIRAEHLAAINLIAQTPEGKATHKAGTTTIASIGGALLDVFKPIAGAIAIEFAPGTEKGGQSLPRPMGRNGRY